MTKTTTKAKPLADGEILEANAGQVIVAVQCVRLGHAYRLSIRYRSSGAEIPELCKPFPRERDARHAARVATTLFRAGWIVQDVLDLIAAFAN